MILAQDSGELFHSNLDTPAHGFYGGALLHSRPSYGSREGIKQPILRHTGKATGLKNQSHRIHKQELADFLNGCINLIPPNVVNHDPWIAVPQF